ncbi:hypothetical protein ABPG72_014071 [Tetrahymena utriculariae]
MVDSVATSGKYSFTEDELKNINPKTAFNINIGVLGHIDSGKTSLSKALSVVTSTASMDKNPQSQERGITLDLGFSAFFTKTPERLKEQLKLDYLQFTLVDCPGHASLIKTIIGGASIIDIMFLLIDVNKGIQTQTAECLVVGELLMQKMIVVLNKIDMIPEDKRAETINKKMEQLKKVFSKTKFGASVPMIPIAASQGAIDGQSLNIENLIDCLLSEIEIPQRQKDGPFFFLIDHCFPIKGKGSVVTGTVIQGQHKAGDEVEFPLIKEVKKSKQIQMFKKPVETIIQGDRAGILFTQLDNTLIERGIACTPGIIQFISYAIIPVNKVNYFKYPISSKGKFHVTTGHQTLMASIKLFKVSITQEDLLILESTKQNINFQTDKNKKDTFNFDFNKEYEYVENYDDYIKVKKPNECLFALLEFEKPVCASNGTLFICSKFDTDITANICRIGFYGNLITQLTQEELKNKKLKIFREKLRQGIIEKVSDDYSVIIKDMFKKETKIEVYVNKPVEISLTKNVGKIQGAFGKSGKVKAVFPNGVLHQVVQVNANGEEQKQNQDDILTEEKLVGQIVVLKYNKILFNK